MAEESFPLRHLCGWIDDPARHALARTFAPPLSQVAPHLMAAPPVENALLYKAWKDVNGSYPAYVAQKIGDCFPAGTTVTMADGSDKPIEKIVMGDIVMSHLNRPRQVLDVVIRQYTGDLVTISAHAPGVPISATPDHRFVATVGQPLHGVWSSLSWVPIARLHTGDEVLIPRGNGGPLTSSIREMSRQPFNKIDVYCLEVEGDHSFIANGYAVHNCTSFGSGHANDLNIAVEMVIGKPWMWEETCTEFIYSMGRKIANMRGGGDGCYGVAVAKALVTYGAVPRSLVGSYDGNRAKQWGDHDPPQAIIDDAAKHKVANAALLTSTEELRAAIANGYPCAGGFTQGFTMHRDSNGCCQQTGRWGHEQCIAAYRNRGGSFEYLFLQSWGSNVPDGPLTDDQPDFSFWVNEQSTSSVISQQDFLAFSGAAGFHTRNIPSDWTHGVFYP